MFYEINEFPGLAALSGAWREIRVELDALGGHGFVDWPEHDLYAGDWRAYPLYRFGERLLATCIACPRTMALVEAVPGMVTAGFSRLAPGTRIRPHTGYSGDLLRFHLGLTEAAGCGLRVGNEVRQWSPGSAFVFDDTVEHEAWNLGAAHRVILLLDFKRDPTRPVAWQTRDPASRA